MTDPGASQSQLVAFAHCMQAHGVPDFPEPNAQGVFSGAGVSDNAPGFRAAANRCSHLLPNGGRPTPAQDAQAVAQALEFSRCMRAHSIADYPDPKITNGGADISFSLRGVGAATSTLIIPGSRPPNRPARASWAGLSAAARSPGPTAALNEGRDQWRGRPGRQHVKAYTE